MVFHAAFPINGRNIFLEIITIYFFWYESFYTFAQEKERKKENLFSPHYHLHYNKHFYPI